MEPNERHHHQQQRHLTSPYYYPFNHHNPTTVSAAPATTSTGNSIPSSNNANFPPPANDGSSSAVAAPIVPVKKRRGRPRNYVTPEEALAASTARERREQAAAGASHLSKSGTKIKSLLGPGAAPIDPVKKKRGRHRNYVTPEEALEASTARERREQAVAAAAAAGVSLLSKSGTKRKSLLGPGGKSRQNFTPHIVNITPGEDVAQKIILLAEQSEHELCILSASGAISNASLSNIATGTSVSYQGQYEILSLSGSYIRGEHGGKTGGLSVCLSSSDGKIFGGGVGGLLKAAGPVQVILGTFQRGRKKDGRDDVKGDDGSGSGSLLPSPSGTDSLQGYHPGMESSGRNPNDEHHTMTSGALGGGGAHFMMQPPQGMHTHTRPSASGTDSLHGYRPSTESSGRNPNDEHHTMPSGALGGVAHFMMQPPQGMHTHTRPSVWWSADQVEAFYMTGLKRR